MGDRVIDVSFDFVEGLAIDQRPHRDASLHAVPHLDRIDSCGQLFCKVIRDVMLHVNSIGITMGPLIDRKAFDKVKRHVDDAISHGAARIAGSTPIAPQANEGCFFPPTVLRSVTAQMECVNDETFGPLAPIIEFQSEAEVIAAANNTEYGLAAYIFTASDERAARVIPRLSFGHVGHNTGSGPTAEAPFGGMKHSGFGREGGLEGLHDFIETQTVPRPS